MLWPVHEPQSSKPKNSLAVGEVVDRSDRERERQSDYMV